MIMPVIAMNKTATTEARLTMARSLEESRNDWGDRGPVEMLDPCAAELAGAAIMVEVGIDNKTSAFVVCSDPRSGKRGLTPMLARNEFERKAYEVNAPG